VLDYKFIYFISYWKHNGEASHEMYSFSAQSGN
jgi:hypothetical protein